MTRKLITNTTDSPVDINNNFREQGETNKNEVHNDQHVTSQEKNKSTTGSPSDNSKLSDMTYGSSTSNYNS